MLCEFEKSVVLKGEVRLELVEVDNGSEEMIWFEPDEVREFSFGNNTFEGSELLLKRLELEGLVESSWSVFLKYAVRLEDKFIGLEILGGGVDWVEDRFKGVEMIQLGMRDSKLYFGWGWGIEEGQLP